MTKENLETSVHIRLHNSDMDVIKSKAKELRMPVSTYCRSKITEDIQTLETA